MVALPSLALLRRLAAASPVAGAGNLVAHQAADVFALWLAWEAECGARCDPPFWATVWPAARVLAGYLLAQPDRVAGRTVLDLGCGGAVAGIAAAKAGASAVVANDIDPAALCVAELNAAANGVRLSLAPGDLTTTAAAREDVILVADLFYERDPSMQLLGWLHASAARGTRVLVADGGRPFSPGTPLVDVHQDTVAVSKDLEGTATRIVHIRELRP
jgi:predicted nicotinamide N-methyase